MGRVYSAWDLLLSRPVALKEARNNESASRRLAREAQITAALNHPGIVSVHDAGITAEGQPFYTMRLIAGRPLSELLEAAPDLPARLAKLRNILDACEAMAYAHSQGVIHRDLKPENIMVGPFGETAVVDWGLALRMGEERPTAESTIVGTPAYMAPEQARGMVVGYTGDVFGLGAVLYEVLEGESPWGDVGREESLRRAAAGKLRPMVEAPGKVPPELLAIVQKALTTDPSARYPDARALAEDLERYLDGLPVRAYHYRPRDALLRFILAWRAPLTVGLVAFGLLGLGSILYVVQLGQARDRAQQAEGAAKTALQDGNIHLGQALAAQATAAAERGELAAAEVLAGNALRYVESASARGVLAGVLPGPRPLQTTTFPLPSGCEQVNILDEDDLICGNEASVRRVQSGKIRWEVPGHYSYFFSDRKHLLLRGEKGSEVRRLVDGSLRRSIPDMLSNEDGLVGDWVTGTRSTAAFVSYWSMEEEIRREMYPCGGIDQVGVALRGTGVDYAVICVDGRVGSGSFPEAPSRWVQTEGLAEERSNIGLTSLIPGEDALLVCGTKGWLARYDLSTGATLRIDLPDRVGVRALRWSPDGKVLAMHLDSGGIELRDAHSLAFLLRLPRQEVRALGFGRGGELVVVVGEKLLRLTLPDRMIPAVFPAPSGLTSVAWSPDGQKLATSAGRGAMTLWSMVDGQGVRQENGEYMMKQVVWAGDLPVGAMIRLNNKNEVGESQYHALPFPVLLVGAARRAVPIGDQIVYSSLQDYLGVAPIGGGNGRMVEDCPRSVYMDLAGAPGGNRGVVVSQEGRVYPLLPGPHCLAPLDINGAIGADVSEDGSRYVVATRQGFGLYPAAGPATWSLSTEGALPLDVALSPDNRWVAAGLSDHRIWLVNAENGVVRAVLFGHRDRVASVDFHPSRPELASAGWDSTVRRWDLSVLEGDTEQLRIQAERTWDLSLEEVLSSR